MRDFAAGLALVLLAMLWPPPVCGEDAQISKLIPTESESLFLDRLMAAESGGRLNAKNPASSALGPYQFIHTTFLDVMRRNFPALAEGKTDAEILQLRTDPAVSRNAALAYTRENAAYLATAGEVTPAKLRLAFFAGPGAALKVLTAKPEEPLTNLFSSAALEANPFLRGMTAGELIERSSREAAGVGTAFVHAVPKAPAKTDGIAVRCNLGLASCRKWLALAKKRLARQQPKLTSVRG